MGQAHHAKHVVICRFSMARPAQQSLVDAVEAIRQCGVAETPEVELIEDMMLAVRGRARGPDISGSREQQRQGLTRCL